MSVAFVRVPRADCRQQQKASRHSASAPSQHRQRTSTEEETSELRFGAAHPHANVTTASAALTVATSSQLKFSHPPTQLSVVTRSRSRSHLPGAASMGLVGTTCSRGNDLIDDDRARGSQPFGLWQWLAAMPSAVTSPRSMTPGCEILCVNICLGGVYL